MVRNSARKGDRKSLSSTEASTKAEVPNIYRDMLADATSSPTRSSDEGRTVKKRRVGGRIVTSHDDAPPAQADLNIKVEDAAGFDELFDEPIRPSQEIVQTESEDSADSDMDWEEVDLGEDHAHEEVSMPENAEAGDLQLVLGQFKSGSAAQRITKRKPLTTSEKKLRLEIHKMHLCCLLVHLHSRNHWCNDEQVHLVLRSLLTSKNISYLNPDESKTQFQRSRSFMDGLTQASEVFRGRFMMTARGMVRSRWSDSLDDLSGLPIPEDVDLPMQKEDFVSAAKRLKGSRDVGAQLFCALLRSTGVDVRLVCSLQPLPFRAMNKAVTPQKSYAATVQFVPGSRDGTPDDEVGINSGHEGSPLVRAAIQSGGEASRSDVERTSARPGAARRPIRESKYPVYWVEAFNEAAQKWIPVDPLVTKTIAKPSKFEPPAGERENNLSYVVAFEDDGSAHDVTKRYAKAYNAKTRRERVEATKDGDRWWRRVMRMYKPYGDEDRKQVEYAELAAKEAAEGIPRNVQDFKNHPYYALERHLKRHEVIHPKKEVGKVNAGRGNKQALMESIYRRRDVQTVQSGDKWYRTMGREIKPGEQPLKRVAARRSRETVMDAEDEEADTEDNVGTALYAIHQTTLYTAPPVVKGRIPKNVYGNLDIYVPSMVPPGGTHVRHPETVRAARILGIDYADAVTGFSFKGRHGTAMTMGAVIAEECSDALFEVINALEDERAQEEAERRTREAVRLWKRFLAGLRIRQRIEGYEVEGAREDVDQDMGDTDEEEYDDDEGGGFFPDRDVEVVAEPTASRAPHVEALPDPGGGFVAEEPEAEEESEIDHRPADHFIDNFKDDLGGGFLIDDDKDEEVQIAAQPRPELGSISSGTNYTEPITGANDPDQEHEISSNIFTHEKKITPPKDELNKNIELDAGLAPEVVQESLERNTKGAKADISNTELSLGLTRQQMQEARMLQQFYEAESESKRDSKVNISSDTKQPSEMVANPPLTSAAPPLSPLTGPSVSEQTHKIANQQTQAISESSEEDNGSLISHDPEDEDADPEWLV